MYFLRKRWIETAIILETTGLIYACVPRGESGGTKCTDLMCTLSQRCK